MSRPPFSSCYGCVFINLTLNLLIRVPGVHPFDFCLKCFIFSLDFLDGSYILFSVLLFFKLFVIFSVFSYYQTLYRSLSLLFWFFDFFFITFSTTDSKKVLTFVCTYVSFTLIRLVHSINFSLGVNLCDSTLTQKQICRFYRILVFFLLNKSLLLIFPFYEKFSSSFFDLVFPVVIRIFSTLFF